MSELAHLSDTELMALLQHRLKPPVAPDTTDYSPTAGMSPLERGVAGVGMGMTNVGRGLGQLVGLESSKDIAEAKRLDAPLANTTAGKVGNVAGTVAALLPTALIPGANTLAGAAAIGAGSGALATPGDVKDRAIAGGEGMLGGLGGLVAGRVIGSGIGAVQSLVAPLVKRGQEQVAARVLEQFAGGPQAARDAVTEIAARGTGPRAVPVQPTAAELTDNAGLHQLERSLAQRPELKTDFDARLRTNREAVKNTLGDIAGDDTKLAAATKARKDTAGPMYDEALDTAVKPDKDLAGLLKKPSMQQAMARATELAEENGVALTKNKKLTGNALHYLKLAMDDLLETPAAEGGLAKNQAGAVRKTRDALVDWMDKKVDGYKAARETYAEMSKPVGQMKIGQELKDKLTPAMADFGADRLTPNSFAGAMRNADQTARLATGFPASTLENTMTAPQMAQLRGIGGHLADRANVDATRTAGSPTLQNMLADNMMRQTLGPLGLPQSAVGSVARSALGRLLGSPAQAANKLLGGEIEGNVRQLLANALLNPAEAMRLLQMAPQHSAALSAALRSEPYLTSIGAGMGGANVGQ